MKVKNFDKNFVLVVIGQIISILGSAILRFALDLYILDITSRADIFAAVLAISAIPIVIFSPVGGAVADRVNRRNLMVIFDFASSFTVLVLIMLLVTDNAGVIGVGVIMTVLSLISAMYQPAVQASIPLLVKSEGLVQANGIVNGVSALSNLLGPVLGGVLYGLLGLNTLVIFSCIAFALSAVMEIFIKIPFIKPELSGHIIPAIIKDMKNGLSYIIHKNNIVFRIIIITAALNMFLSSFIIIGAPYVIRIVMQSSEFMYGISMGAMQLSGIIGAVTVGFFAKKMKLDTLYKPMIYIALFILPMILALMPFMLEQGYLPSFIIFNAAIMIIMLFATVISVYVISEVQKETPNELLGKVMAIIMAAAHCAMPLGQLIYGALFEAFSDTVYIPVIIAFLLTFWLGLLSRRLLKNNF